MPHLPIPKHPLIGQRNAMVLQAIALDTPTKECAKKFRISVSRVRQIAREYGNRKGFTPNSFTGKRLVVLRQLVRLGLSSDEIARQMHVDAGTIRRVLRRLGLQRPTGRPRRTEH